MQVRTPAVPPSPKSNSGRKQGESIRLAIVAICAEGHVLFEDVPGTGKSMLARAIAQSIKAIEARVQCTPDMLPGDITGSSIYDPKTQEFSFRPGPVFCNVLLADEVNRATPKTQSSLLEAMAERKVTSDGVTRELPRPFLVLATQNPVELAGTFPLPEAQLDRFLFKLQMGYPDAASELEVMFANSVNLAIEDLTSVVDTGKVNQMIRYAATVHVSQPVGEYIVSLAHATRAEPSLQLGASPRASIALLRAARVLAAADGREHVYPDDVRVVLNPVMGHRLILQPEAVLRGETIEALLDRVVGKVKAPLMSHTTTVEGAGSADSRRKNKAETKKVAVGS
ncbi:MAG: AAA family ATPase [Chloroflexi bacterium]|nr:AAA family ATPase [Chloroflexota bacterium]